MKKFVIKPCQKAYDDHKKSCRAFAHTFHKTGVICVAPAFYELPQTFQVGILLHELGHLALEEVDHTEKQADEMGFILSGVPIERRRYHSARNLEYVRPAHKGKALRFLREYTADASPNIRELQ